MRFCGRTESILCGFPLVLPNMRCATTGCIRREGFGTGTLLVCAKANRDGDVLLENIKQPRMVNDLLSELVEKARDQKRVVGKEFYGPEGHASHDMDPDDSDE